MGAGGGHGRLHRRHRRPPRRDGRLRGRRSYQSYVGAVCAATTIRGSRCATISVFRNKSARTPVGREWYPCSSVSKQAKAITRRGVRPARRALEAGAQRRCARTCGHDREKARLVDHIQLCSSRAPQTGRLPSARRVEGRRVTMAISQVGRLVRARRTRPSLRDAIIRAGDRLCSRGQGVTSAREAPVSRCEITLSAENSRVHRFP